MTLDPRSSYDANGQTPPIHYQVWPVRGGRRRHSFRPSDSELPWRHPPPEAATRHSIPICLPSGAGRGWECGRSHGNTISDMSYGLCSPGNGMRRGAGNFMASGAKPKMWSGAMVFAAGAWNAARSGGLCSRGVERGAERDLRFRSDQLCDWSGRCWSTLCGGFDLCELSRFRHALSLITESGGDVGLNLGQAVA